MDKSRKELPNNWYIVNAGFLPTAQKKIDALIGATTKVYADALTAKSLEQIGEAMDKSIHDAIKNNTDFSQLDRFWSTGFFNKPEEARHEYWLANPPRNLLPPQVSRTEFFFSRFKAAMDSTLLPATDHRALGSIKHAQIMLGKFKLQKKGDTGTTYFSGDMRRMINTYEAELVGKQLRAEASVDAHYKAAVVGANNWLESTLTGIFLSGYKLDRGAGQQDVEADANNPKHIEEIIEKMRDGTLEITVFGKKEIISLKYDKNNNLGPTSEGIAAILNDGFLFRNRDKAVLKAVAAITSRHAAGARKGKLVDEWKEGALETQLEFFIKHRFDMFKASVKRRTGRDYLNTADIRDFTGEIEEMLESTATPPQLGGKTEDFDFTTIQKKVIDAVTTLHPKDYIKEENREIFRFLQRASKLPVSEIAAFKKEIFESEALTQEMKARLTSIFGANYKEYDRKMNITTVENGKRMADIRFGLVKVDANVLQLMELFKQIDKTARPGLVPPGRFTTNVLMHETNTMFQYKVHKTLDKILPHFDNQANSIPPDVWQSIVSGEIGRDGKLKQFIEYEYTDQAGVKKTGKVESVAWYITEELAVKTKHDTHYFRAARQAATRPWRGPWVRPARANGWPPGDMTWIQFLYFNQNP